MAKMSEKTAKVLICILLAMSVIGTIISVFIDQSIFLALTCISGIFTFLFGLQNPKVLTSTSWDELGEHFDNAPGKEKLTGTPLYFATVFFSVLYIILV